ncbi:unnamed protein product, partial [Discosporangium mesarthrocarpum]
MGSYLSQPITDKETEDGGEHGGLLWGAAAMQGWRTGMEDAHLASLNLRQTEGEGSAEAPVAIFGVFDGHGGAEVAKYCANHMCKTVRDTEGFKEGDLAQGLKQAFLRLDEMIRAPQGQEELAAIKKAENNNDSDQDEEEDSSDFLSKMPPEMHVMIMEQMKKALSNQFTSGGTLEGKMGGEVDEEDEDYKEEEEEEEEESGSDDDVDGEEAHEGDGCEVEGTDEGSSGAGVSSMEEATTDDGNPGIRVRASPVSEGKGEGKGKASLGVGQGATSVTTEDQVEVQMNATVQSGQDGEGRAEGPEEVDQSEKWLVDQDEESSMPMRRQGFDCGATAVLGLVVGARTLVVANAGDSRCVVSRKGVSMDMSTDHKPEDEPELSRITKAGGAVLDGRVQGNLNLSRAIGDLTYKSDTNLPPEEQMITALPELQTLEITDEDEFIVFACDGVWNVLSSQETVDFIRQRLTKDVSLSGVCSDLCDACCAENTDGDGRGLDNVTALVVMLPTPAAEALVSYPLTVGVGSGERLREGVSGEGDEGDEGDGGKRKIDEHETAG